jgi:hypothetical protein
MALEFQAAKKPPSRHGRARPGHPRGAVSGRSEASLRLDDVDDRDKPGNDGSAVVILAPYGAERR